MIAHWYLEASNAETAAWTGLLAARENAVLRLLLAARPDDPDCGLGNADRKPDSPPETAD